MDYVAHWLKSENLKPHTVVIQLHVCVYKIFVRPFESYNCKEEYCVQSKALGLLVCLKVSTGLEIATDTVAFAT